MTITNLDTATRTLTEDPCECALAKPEPCSRVAVQRLRFERECAHPTAVRLFCQPHTDFYRTYLGVPGACQCHCGAGSTLVSITPKGRS